MATNHKAIPAPIKRWAKRKQGHYKLATGDYLIRLREALGREIELISEKANAKTLKVSLDKIEDGVDGLSLERTSLVSASRGDKVCLVHCESKKEVARGQVLVDGSANIRIKLKGKLEKVKVGEGEEEGEKNDDDDLEEAERKTKSHYLIKFDEKGSILSTKKRVEHALKGIEKIKCSLNIHKCLLGCFDEKANIKFPRFRQVYIDGLKEPKGVQVLAIAQALQKRIALIEGVAGSGKTLVAAHIACSMSRLKARKVLFCSPVQATVERVAKMIAEANGVCVVRLAQKGENQDEHLDYSNTLEAAVDEAVYWRRFKRDKLALRGPQKQQARLNEHATRMIKNCSPWLRRKVEREVLREADVVCCTLTQAGDLRLKGVKFGMLIIDDAQVATEVGCMVALMAKGVKQVTLLSDTRQAIRFARSSSTFPNFVGLNGSRNGLKASPAVLKQVNRQENSSKGRRSSRQKLVMTDNDGKNQNNQQAVIGNLFERLLDIGISAVDLTYQFRMLDTLTAFPNHHFYLSRLKTDTETNVWLTNKIRTDLLTDDDETNWLPNNKCSTALFDVASGDQNLKVQEIVNNLMLKEDMRKSRIGIIANDLIGASKLLSLPEIKGIDVGTVEDFIGREKDFIILSGRCSEMEKTQWSSMERYSHLNCDYLKSSDALHIAVTRARLGLFVVTNLENLPENQEPQAGEINCQSTPAQANKYCRSWKDLVKIYRKNKLVSARFYNN